MKFGKKSRHFYMKVAPGSELTFQQTNTFSVIGSLLLINSIRKKEAELSFF
jgi:hypothetical protein